MSYIEKVLKRFGMQGCKPHDTLVSKGDKVSLNQYLKNSLKVQEMRKIPYSSVIGFMNYAQVCTCSDIAYIVGILSRYLSNPSMDYWKAIKQVMRYL